MAHSPRSEAKKPQATKSLPAPPARAAKKPVPEAAAAKKGSGTKTKTAPKAAAASARMRGKGNARPSAATKPPAAEAIARANGRAQPKAVPFLARKNAAAKLPASQVTKPSAPASSRSRPTDKVSSNAASVTNGRRPLTPAQPSPGGAVLRTPATPTAASAAAPPAAKVGTNKRAAGAAAKTAEPATKPSAKTAPAAPSAPLVKKPARKSIKEAAGVSTDAVARRTGKSWDDWFEVLDNAGAATLDQRGIIAILAQKHGIGPWWQQMIAVGYESLRSKSDKPPAADGFQIISSCTLDAPLSRVFRLWNDAGERARWLSDDRFVVRGTTGDKTIRARWGKGTSHVAVSFAEKSGRTQVSVEHLQIESRDAAEQMKAYWAKKLGLLDQALSPRRGP